MNTQTPSPDLLDSRLSELAATRAGASRVFARHRLDFCCHGNVTVAEACVKAGLDAADLIAELRAEERVATDFRSWVTEPLTGVIDHVLTRFHEPLRQELPRLVRMAERVEAVHGHRDDAPGGLGAHLTEMTTELELHMQKEERILFPLVRDGHGGAALAPIRMMEQEHEDLAGQLARTRSLTGDMVPPDDACGTWRALYAGLIDLELDLMEHVHLENAVLFPRALGRPVAAASASS